MTYEKLLAATRGLNRRFPKGTHPYQIMTRLLEESGELAQMVNHFEGAGVKSEKYGMPCLTYSPLLNGGIITAAWRPCATFLWMENFNA